MSKYLLFGLLLLLIAFYGCDPGFSYYVSAKYTYTLVETSPSLESVYCTRRQQDLCAFVRTHRIDEKGESARYRFSEGEQLEIYSDLGTKASAAYFPFNFIRIITKNDTLVFSDKESFLEKFVRKQNNKYYLEF